MAIETTTILICDRCGSRHDQATHKRIGNDWAHVNISYHGDKGGRCWDGTLTGMAIKGTAWLCTPCTEAFLAFMDPQSNGMEKALLQALDAYPGTAPHQLQAAKVCRGVKALALMLTKENKAPDGRAPISRMLRGDKP